MPWKSTRHVLLTWSEKQSCYKPFPHLSVIVLNASAILLEFSVSADASQLWNGNCNRNITFSSTVETEKVHFFDRQRNGMTLSTGSFLSLGLKAVFGSCLEREKGRWLCLSVGFLRQFDQQVSSTSSQLESFWAFLNATHFSFSLFLWANWGCAGEALVLERSRNFNKMLALTF